MIGDYFRLVISSPSLCDVEILNALTAKMTKWQHPSLIYKKIWLVFSKRVLRMGQSAEEDIAEEDVAEEDSLEYMPVRVKS